MNTWDDAAPAKFPLISIFAVCEIEQISVM